MDRKRLSRILARACREDVAAITAGIRETHRPVIVKPPGKSLAMIKMREPVRQSLFYIGEVIVCEAVVEIDGARGFAVLMGDDEQKTLDMAIIDAAFSKGVFICDDRLYELEREQKDIAMRENAMHLKTMVNFESIDRDVPDELSVNKKA